jgi:hypothetical protein
MWVIYTVFFSFEGNMGKAINPPIMIEGFNITSLEALAGEFCKALTEDLPYKDFVLAELRVHEITWFANTDIVIPERVRKGLAIEIMKKIRPDTKWKKF